VPKGMRLSALLEALSLRSGGTIHYHVADRIAPPGFYFGAVVGEELAAARFNPDNLGQFNPARRLASYSSLQRKYGADDVHRAYGYDEHENNTAPGFADTGAEDRIPPVFRFPKGANTGNLWHELFERI